MLTKLTGPTNLIFPLSYKVGLVKLKYFTNNYER
jgi:hypothetical protein